MNIEQQAADGALDFLLGAENNLIRKQWGRTLVTLAQEAFGDPTIQVGDPEYVAMSKAVIMLEEMDFVTVLRAHEKKHHRANIIIEIKLKDDES